MTEEIKELPLVSHHSSLDHPEITRLVNANQHLMKRLGELKLLLANETLPSEERSKCVKEINFLTNLIIQQDGVIKNLRELFKQQHEEVSSSTSASSSSEVQPSSKQSVDWHPIDLSGVEYVPGHNQVKYQGNTFNYHHDRKTDNVKSFRCNKYRDLHCPAQILVDPNKKVVSHRNVHNHIPIREITPEIPVSLSESRKRELQDYLEEHPTMTNDSAIATALNNALEPWQRIDPRWLVKVSDVQEARQMLFSLDRLVGFEDLYSRKDLSNTEDGQEFVVYAALLQFGVMWASPWQLNFLNNNLKPGDLLFMDEQYRNAPKGIKQVLTLLYCRTDPHTHRMVDEEAVPILFCVLNDKAYLTCKEMWYWIIKKLPTLTSVNHVFLSMFPERNMIKAVSEELPNLSIIQCNLHVRQAIDQWIDSNWTTELQDAWKSKVIFDFPTLSRLKFILDGFKEACDHFLYKYTLLDSGRFSDYMCKTWIGAYAPSYSSNVVHVMHAQCPPTVWASSLMSDELFARVEETNKQGEVFHERFDAVLQHAPGTRKFVLTLRGIEKNYRTTLHFNVQDLSHVLALPENPYDFNFSDFGKFLSQILESDSSSEELEDDSYSSPMDYETASDHDPRKET